MKRLFFLLIILNIGLNSTAQTERNYAQELVNMLHQERYFDAIDFKKKYSEELPKNDRALDLVYGIHMYLAFNQLDSASVYLEELLPNPEYETIMGPILGSYYGKLIKTYEDQQNFTSAILSTDKAIAFFARNPFDMNQEFIQNEINFLKQKKHLLEEKSKKPFRRVERQINSLSPKIKLINDKHLLFYGLYNEQKIETLFDTGLSYYFLMEEDVAKEIGLNNFENQKNTHTINGLQTDAFISYLDSVDFDGIKLYNIPVLIMKNQIKWDLPDMSDVTNQITKKKKQIIMGLPAMKMIGKIEIDWVNKFIEFPEREIPKELNTNSNIFLVNDIPYINLNINTCKYTGLLDTGSDHFLFITYPYFTANYKNFELDIEPDKLVYNRQTLIKSYNNIPYQILRSPQISLNGAIIKNDGENKSLVIDPIWTSENTFDGQVGLELIKNVAQKVIIDLDNMTIE